MTEYRCKFCHRLLFRYFNDDIMFLINYDEVSIDETTNNEKTTGLEIKCSKCDTLNKFGFAKIKEWQFVVGSAK